MAMTSRRTELVLNNIANASGPKTGLIWRLAEDGGIVESHTQFLVASLANLDYGPALVGLRTGSRQPSLAKNSRADNTGV